MKKFAAFGASLAATLALGVGLALAQQSTVSGVPGRLRVNALGVNSAVPANGNITASGTVTGANVTATGTVTAATVTASGTVTGATVNATGALQLNGVNVAAGFQGATVRKTAAQTGLSSAGTIIAVTWDAEVTDTNSYHDNVTNNSRVLLPTQTGFAQCSADMTGLTATTTAATASETRAYICVNGAGSCSGGSTVVVASETPLYDDGGTAGGTFLPSWRTSMVTPILAVTGGDYAEAFVYFSGYSANTNSVSADSANSASQARMSCWAVK